jgi:hypothetical protein
MTRGRIMVQTRHEEGRPHAQRTPNRDQQVTDTPASDRSTRPSLDSQLKDPTYIPSESPRSRLELRTTREEPPVTRARMRLHALQDRPNQARHDHADMMQCAVLNKINNGGRKAFTKMPAGLTRVDKERHDGAILTTFSPRKHASQLRRSL